VITNGEVSYAPIMSYEWALLRAPSEAYDSDGSPNITGITMELLTVGCGEFSAIFFIALLNSPCYETPKNAITKKIEQNNRGRKKKTGKKTFFVMSPDAFLSKTNSCF
jgi:hypothetical protein